MGRRLRSEAARAGLGHPSASRQSLLLAANAASRCVSHAAQSLVSPVSARQMTSAAAAPPETPPAPSATAMSLRSGLSTIAIRSSPRPASSFLDARRDRQPRDQRCLLSFLAGVSRRRFVRA